MKKTNTPDIFGLDALTSASINNFVPRSEHTVTYIDARMATNNVLNVHIGDALVTSDFDRSGKDLHLLHDNKLNAVLENYFSQSSLPDLLSETGKKILGHSVSLLAGPEAPGQYAGPQGGHDAIGTVEKLQGDVHVTRADGTETNLKAGDPVFQDDVIKTANNGDIGIKFVDGSVFTLGSDARMTIDELVYDAKTGEGHSDISVINGMFKFVSGDISANNPGDMKVHTPVATIGIRGTTGGGNVEGEGGDNQFYLEPNADGTVGWFDVITDKGMQSLNQPNTVVAVSSISAAPPAPVNVPAATLQQRFGEVIQFAPAVDKYHQPDRQPQSQNGANANAEANAAEAAQPTNAANGEAPANAEATAPAAPAATVEQAATAAPAAPITVTAEPNAAFTTDQTTTETPAAEAALTEGLKPFSGEAQFDGQANTETPKTETVEFIPVLMESAEAKPGFTTAGNQGFVSAPDSAFNSSFQAAPVTAGSHAGAATAMPTVEATVATLAAPGTVATAPVATFAAPTTYTNTSAEAAATSPSTATNTSRVQNIIADQQAVASATPPVIAAPTTPTAPSNGTNTPPTTAPTQPLPNGGGGAGVTNMTFTLDASANAYTGGAGNDLFVTTNSAFQPTDSLAGGAGTDTIRFTDAATITDASFSNKVGIERLELTANGNVLTLANNASAFITNSETKTCTLAHGTNTITNLNTTQLSVGSEVIVDGTGDVTLSGGRLTVAGNATNTTGDGVSELVTFLNATNATMNGGGGNDTFIIRGGSGHSINGGTSNDEFYAIDNATNATLIGSQGANGFYAKNASNISMVGGTGTDEFRMYGNTSGMTLEGGGGADTFELIGGSGAMNIFTGNSDSAVDKIFTHGYTGTANISADGTDEINIGKLEANLVVTHTGGGTIKLNLSNYTYSQLGFAAFGNDLKITADSGSLTLSNFFSGNNNYDLLTKANLDSIMTRNPASLDLVRNLSGVSALSDLDTGTTGTAGNNQITVSSGQNDNTIAGSGDDTLIAASGATGFTMYGGMGNDYFKLATSGSYTINGGTGFDIVDFSGFAASPGTINFSASNFIDVEGGVGSEYDDVIYATGTNFFIEAGKGEDEIWANGANITLSFASASSSVDLNLQAGVVYNDGYGSIDSQPGPVDGIIDTLSGGQQFYRNVIGSNQSDTITGNSEDNIFYGNGGNDSLTGNGGADIFIGGAGNDVINILGAANIDRIVYDHVSEGGDIIHGFNSGGNDLIDIRALTGNLHKKDTTGDWAPTYFDLIKGNHLTLTDNGGNTEVRYDGNLLATLNGVTSSAVKPYNFVTTNGQVKVGTTGADGSLTGTAQDDIIFGKGGTDLIDGGLGNDAIVFDDDTALLQATSIQGGAGSDQIILRTAAAAVNINSLVGKTDGIEKINISGTLDNITLDFGNSLTTTQFKTITSNERDLFVDRDVSGGGADNVVFGTNWVQSSPNNEHDGYTTWKLGSGADVVSVHVQNS